MDPLQRAVLERKMAEALFRRGDNVAAKDYLGRSLARLGTAFIRQMGHRLLPKRAPTSRGGVATDERWRMYEQLAWIDHFVDRERLLLDVLLGLNLAEDRGGPDLIARSCSGVGLPAILHTLRGLRLHTTAVRSLPRSRASLPRRLVSPIIGRDSTSISAVTGRPY
jgi:hypothetical protein